MTQSGQGDEPQLPAVRHAHEGVVLPPEGGAPWNAGGPAGGQPDQAVPAGGQPWGRPWGPQAAHQDGPPPGQLPPEQGPYQQPQHGQYQQPQQYAPQQGQYQQQPYAQPLPPEAAAPGQGRGGDADATQYIAPVPGGPLPGGLPPERPAESTRYLGQSPAPAQPSDADATQYIPPVPGGAPYGIRPGTPGDRQPPAEFDSLFRSDEPAGGATQQMPHFAGPPQQQRPQQPYQPHPGTQQPPQGVQPHQPGPQGFHGGHGGSGPEEPGQGGDAPRRRSAHIPLIAAVVVGCAVIGLGAGALMSGGDKSPSDDKQTVASQSSPAADPSEKAAEDPAQPQAVELDKLLADSNNSRSAVIGAVENIKACKALDQAVTDLKGAAAQRRDLVTRLEALSVDQLPSHEQLKTSLTKAWQASAEADDHYATWASQAKNNKKKVCKGGRAGSTDATAKAAASSSDATVQKRTASSLWNKIAQRYGLTEHAPTQL